jgi:hypothetical protein
MVGSSSGHDGAGWQQQRRSRKIAMTAEERDEFLRANRVCRVATATSSGRPHASALWFVWDGALLWLYSIVRSQRWTDLQNNPRCAVIVDEGAAYSDLRGVELYGRVEVEGEVPRMGSANTALAPVETEFALKYLESSFRYDGRHAWLRMRPEREYTWDFRKLRLIPQAGA